MTQPQTFHLSSAAVAPLLAHLGLRAAPDSPLHAHAAQRAAGALSADGLLADLRSSSLDQATVAAHMRVLAEPARVLLIRRGMRRRPAATFFACIGSGPDADVVSVVQNTPTGVLTLLLPLSRTSLIEWLAAPFAAIPRPAISLTSLPNLTPDMLALLLALGDMFGERVPVPDPEWQPQPMSFTADDLLALRPGSDMLTLPQAYSDLTAQSLPVLTHKQMQTLLLLLATSGTLAVDDELPGQPTRYSLGRRLLWFVRCMAWWDLTLAVRHWQAGGQTSALAAPPLALLQATALWLFEPATAPDSTPTTTLTAIDSSTLAAHLRQVLDDDTAAVAAPARGWSLVAISGDKAGTTYPLGRQMRLGRKEDNDIPINDVKASRYHALIERTASGGYQVTDLGSSNGTRVNDARIAQPTPLNEGDRISIGNWSFVLHAPPAPGLANQATVLASESAPNTCPHCGAQMRAGAAFCGTCGKRRDQESP